MARKRIALSVRPEYHEKLIKLAEYQNRTITTVVNELLNECEVEHFENKHPRHGKSISV